MASLKILIVDDDEDFADGLLEVFELDGHQPRMVHCGRDAIALVEAGQFDAALVDIGLPDMNGAECVLAIKTLQPDLPCLLLTGYSGEDVARQGIEAGAIEIITKPVDPDDLSRRLSEM
jgi:CheY-like chemotaxis protein